MIENVLDPLPLPLLLWLGMKHGHRTYDNQFEAAAQYGVLNPTWYNLLLVS